ncbi:uncharacterized protein LOC130663643 [Microplitis mediator]|uniref:uncharacterized protein LOC130663643 n=1 Tax=Microplitis mediator TaxID=375433 RepID=UPI002555F0E7|nr:uncharacterized protein LOC130663643 [Microplitis mediator]
MSAAIRILASVVILFLLENVSSDKLVIDTDAGADDALAILLVLSAGKISNYELVGITCTYGNTEEENVEQNVLKTLTVANSSHIPVYRGAQKPLMSNFSSDKYFGEDGFGDFDFEDELKGEVDGSTHAAIALINLARKYSGELSILAIGPLTNIALAVSLDPNFMNNVKRLYIMGGSIAGRGNKSPGVEYNFGTDPDSDFIVLNVTRNKPSLLYPWETVLKSPIPKGWRLKEFGSINSSVINFLNKAERKTFSSESLMWEPSDAMTAAVMLCPFLAKSTIEINVTPVTDGVARGTMLIDYSEKSGKTKNVEVIQEFHTEEFKRLLLYYFK